MRNERRVKSCQEKQNKVCGCACFFCFCFFFFVFFFFFFLGGGGGGGWSRRNPIFVPFLGLTYLKLNKNVLSQFFGFFTHIDAYDYQSPVDELSDSSIYLLILSRSISDHHLRCGVGG